MNQPKTTPAASTNQDVGLMVGMTAQPGQGTVTARKAGGLIDMMLPVSPAKVPVKQALENLTKAINLALQSDFLETELDQVYKAARVRKGAVQIQHQDYIGLGDGIFAKFGKTVRSLQLTFRGPDPASPEGKSALEKLGKSRPVGGFINLIGRKMDLLQEYEDKVPTYVEQMLDRLEAARMITGWSRAEWTITTTVLGLDVHVTPVAAAKEDG